MNPRPSLFIGSSTEGHRLAQAIQVLLDPVCEVEIWSQGVFGLGLGTLESLVLSLTRFDFAALVLTADDLTSKRGTEAPSARDNVLFELGLFMGALGRDRTFIIYDRTNPPALPSDLAGVTAATFAPHSSGNIEASLGAACTRIQTAIDRLGVRDYQRVERLSKAAEAVEDVGSEMQKLIRLLARSRKVELDILSNQFAAFLEPEKVRQLEADFRDLDALLNQNN